MNKHQLNVRPATRDDVDKIYYFIKQLAIYEKALHEVKCDANTLADNLFCEQPVAWPLMVEQNGEAIGYAVYFFSFSTWLGVKGLYLEDVYIDPAFRGNGGGILLMKTLAEIALKQRCERFEWSVLDWNTPSIKFYEAMGATPQDEWVKYRLDEAGMQRLVKSALP